MEDHFDYGLPQVSELGEFLDGLIFSPDEQRKLLTECTSIDPLRGFIPVDAGNQVCASIPDERKLSQGNVFLISQSDKKAQDILCLRGNGGIRNPANLAFRQTIAANKPLFDSLPTNIEKQSFSIDLWIDLRDRGHRFLRPAEGDVYEVLDYAKSVRKVLQALQTSRMTHASQASRGNDATATDDIPIQTKMFDDIARASIRQILTRQEFAEAIRKTWCNDAATKARDFEDHVSAISLNNISAISKLVTNSF